MTESDRDATMRRIQKLLAIAGDDRANQAEASAAAAMAEKIMRKYQIDHAEVLVAEMRKGDAFGTADSTANAKTNGTKAKAVPPWASMLAWAAAQLNDCGSTLCWTAEGEKGVRFYGLKQDVLIAKWMFDYLVSTTNRLGREYFAGIKGLEGAKTDLFAYRRGVVSAIISNINKQKREKEAEMQAGVASRALVVMKGQLVTERFGEEVMRSEKVKSKAAIDPSAYMRGMRDGAQVDINTRGIQQDSADTKRLAG